MTAAAPHPDLVVVGAGIVGLAHAVEAVSRGLSVRVIDRDTYAVGASIRNFGHIGLSVQTGMAFDVALAGRSRWLTLAQQSGFWAAEAGSVVVARAEDELSMLKEFAVARDGFAELRDAGQLLDRVPLRGEGIIGGVWLPQDVRVDPLAAVAAIAAWLSQQSGVEISWGTSLLPAHARSGCSTRGHVLPRRPVRVVAAALSRLHRCPSADAVRTRVRREQPELLEAEVNLMFTQRPDGSLVIGDSHEYHPTVPPFAAESVDDLLLAQISALIGASELRVRRRWQGIYAAGGQDFLIAAPAPRVRVVSVTTGIGMTTALGLAPHVLNDLL